MLYEGYFFVIGYTIACSSKKQDDDNSKMPSLKILYTSQPNILKSLLACSSLSLLIYETLSKEDRLYEY